MTQFAGKGCAGGANSSWRRLEGKCMHGGWSGGSRCKKDGVGAGGGRTGHTCVDSCAVTRCAEQVQRGAKGSGRFVFGGLRLLQAPPRQPARFTGQGWESGPEACPSFMLLQGSLRWSCAASHTQTQHAHVLEHEISSTRHTPKCKTPRENSQTRSRLNRATQSNQAGTRRSSNQPSKHRKEESLLRKNVTTGRARREEKRGAFSPNDNNGKASREKAACPFNYMTTGARRQERKGMSALQLHDNNS
eukprot:365111-Chlamydomonas_euryale.AAC.6